MKLIKKFIGPKAILEVLLSGQKIRVTGWKDYEFIYFNSIDGCIYNQSTHPVSSILGLNYTWEIYQEPKNKKEVYQWRVWETNHWYVAPHLMTYDEMNTLKMNTADKFQIHAGPFEVEE